MPIFRSNEALSEQARKIKSKERELSRVNKEIRAATERPKFVEYKRKKHRIQQEIFHLQRELRATTGGAEGNIGIGSLPDFLIIGAMKGGTTFLYNLLTQHPLVESAAFKELHYFDNLIEEEDLGWYRRCFPEPEWKDGRRIITGEATPSYLSHPRVPERTASVVPGVRLIALLRNPVDRAYSHYQQVARKGREPLTFEKAIETKKGRLVGKGNRASGHEDRAALNARCEYLSRGIYVDQLLQWSRFFADEQMLVLKSENLYGHTLDTLRLVLEFLGLPGWEPEAWEQIPKKRNKGKSYEQEMDPATRRRLEAFFEPHNHRLYDHLGVDFGW